MDDLLFGAQLVHPNLEAADAEDAIRQLGQVLVRQACIDPRYIEGVVERERSFPTGVEFPGGPIALPHGDPTFVRRSAIAVAKCSTPVPFHAMGDANATLQTEFVIMLAVSDPDGHLEVLSHLMDALADEVFYRDIQAATGEEAIARLFSGRLVKEVESHGIGL